MPDDVPPPCRTRLPERHGELRHVDMTGDGALTIVPSCRTCRHMRRRVPLIGEMRCLRPEVVAGAEADSCTTILAAVQGCKPSPPPVSCFVARIDVRWPPIVVDGSRLKPGPLAREACGLIGRYWEPRNA